MTTDTTPYVQMPKNRNVALALHEIGLEAERQMQSSCMVYRYNIMAAVERLDESYWLLMDNKEQARIYATELAALIVRLMAERLNN